VTVQDPNTGRYVNTDPNGVKRGDQNFAAIGPARLSSEEETQQQIDKGIPPANIVNIDLGTAVQSPSIFGQFQPDYWYSSEHVESLLTLPTNNRTYWYSFTVTVTATLAELRIETPIGSAAANAGQPGNGIQVALYASELGLPAVKLFESSLYDMSSIPSGPLGYTDIPVDLTLPGGKYWIVVASDGVGSGLVAPLGEIRAMYLSSVPRAFREFPALGYTNYVSDVCFTSYIGSAIGVSPIAGALPTVLDVNSYYFQTTTASVMLWARFVS
jgi:hypothetical protein